MKTTVIVPVYNRPVTLPLAIRSLVDRSGPADLDILIIDDGSTDETPTVISELMLSVPNLRAVHRDNGGVTEARNTGLSHLLPETEVVTFLDSDDVIAEGRFETDLQVLQDNPEVEVTYGDMVITNQINPETLLPTKDAVVHQTTGIHLSSTLMRRSLVDRIGKFDPELKQAEDTDYLLRIFESGTKFIQTTTVCHYYLRHPESLTKRIEEAKMYFARAVLKSMQRRRSDPSLHLNKPSFNVVLPVELL